MTDIVERSKQCPAVCDCDGEPCLLYELRAEIERLRALLGKLRWKSIDKDNMEFRCDTTCYVMDEIRRALETKP